MLMMPSNRGRQIDFEDVIGQELKELQERIHGKKYFEKGKDIPAIPKPQGPTI